MQITIRADEGKWLTDGKNYGKTISLGKGVSVNNYYEISDKEYEEKMKEIESHLQGDIV